ncbi:hypothetical protein COHA_007500 [Chlorella ohadii]|uniref:Protein kinase domain-containing protein n=1 Tax=Chlorella ohadii TaxID=2649997 RepID=A0AAD5DLX5_9CHLO|nr:hypothetical protein COHA_007500 [Chlorella ohadii]
MGCAQSVHDVEAAAAARDPSASSSRKTSQPLKKAPAPAFGDEFYEKALAAVYANKALPPGGPPSAELEGRRIQALHALHALEPSELDARLNTIVELMQSTFQVDYAALSLIDVDYQIFKVKAGWPIDATDRQTAFGSWALASEHAKMLVVEDTLADARFRGNPLVTSPRTALRFYAGAPLMSSDGSGAYGMLLIGDRAPRHFAAEQLAILSNFAELCARKLECAAPGRLTELRARAAAARTGAAPKLDRELSAFNDAVLMVDCETDAWLLRWGNTQFEELAGVAVAGSMGKDIWTLFRMAGADPEEALIEANAAIFCQKPFSLAVTRPGDPERLRLQLRPASLGLRNSGIPQVGIPAHVASLASEGGMCEQLAADSQHIWFATLSKEAPPAAVAAAPPAGTPVPRDELPELAPTSPRAASPGALKSCLSFSRGCGSPRLVRSLSFTVDDKLSWQQVFKDAKLGPLLGSGSYGRVYRGQWRGTEVAIKVMDYYAPADGSAFQLTAEKHSALLEALVGRNFAHHPNLVQASAGLGAALLAVDSDDAILKGRFRNSLAPDSGPNLLFILLTAQEIAGGMTLLHDSGIIHGDLSANNVLLNAAANRRRFTAAVSDFGLARMCADHSGKHTETVGTVTHQPPELLREGLLTSAADVWAFGVLLWSMYTGEQPFSGEHSVAIIAKVSSSQACPLELPLDAPADFRALFERCTSYDLDARPTFHEILDTLAPMLEAAEAAAPPALSRSRLAQLQAASPRVQDSPIPSRAGSLPLPLPEVVVEEGRATADAGLVVPAQLPAAAGRPPSTPPGHWRRQHGAVERRGALLKCGARPDSPYEPLERAVQVINRVIAVGEKAKWGSGEAGGPGSSSAGGSEGNPAQERWVQFAAVFNSSLAVDQPAPGALPSASQQQQQQAVHSSANSEEQQQGSSGNGSNSSNGGSGSSGSSGTSGGSGPSGRLLRDYLALPIEQYSLLDPKWISREEGGMFRFSLPLQDLVNVELQPEIYFSVLTEPQEARRLRRWAAAARGRTWPAPEGVAGSTAAAAPATAAVEPMQEASSSSSSNGSSERSGAGPEAAATAAVATVDESSAVPFPGQHVYISHDENDSDEYDEADSLLAAAELAPADLGDAALAPPSSSNGSSGSSDNSHGSSGGGSGDGSSSSSVLPSQQAAADAAGMQRGQAAGQPGPRAVLHCRTRVTMAVRVPGPLRVVPNALLGYAGSLLLRTILSATLPNFLALLAADYRRWAGIAGTGDSSARQLDAPVGELFSDAAAAVQEGRQRRQHQTAGGEAEQAGELPPGQEEQAAAPGEQGQAQAQHLP